MARIVALNAIFFLVPFAIYALWLALSQRSLSDPKSWPVRSVIYLALGGFALTSLALVFFIHFSAAPPGAEYRPARIDESGRIIPGTLD
jgi:hypothetical protein